jgi:Co/Zn/Cd efflux system component
MNADAARADDEGRVFARVIWAIALGLLVFAAAQVAVALAIGNAHLFKDGVDWVYDVLLYGLAAATFGRGARLERASAVFIAAVMGAAGAHTLWDLADKIARPRPIEPLIFGFSAASAVVIALLIVAALWRFRASAHPLIEATWLSSRNDVLKTTFYVGLGFLARVAPQRWPEYALDVLMAAILFQASWRILARALHDARKGSNGTGESGS